MDTSGPNQRVNIPSQLVEKSEILVDAMSSVNDPYIARDFTLNVPQEWLRAWVARYGSEDACLSNADIEDLVNCLLVCFFSWNITPTVLIPTRSGAHAVSILAALKVEDQHQFTPR
jgi:hypothetical protein